MNVNASFLVGRELELSLLDAALDACANGERAVVLLSGEAGIGKTRLLEELARRSLARGSRVAWGRTWELGITPAFWPWLQILSSFASPTPLDDLDLRANASARLARFVAVAQQLSAWARAAPLTLILDDLHVADRSSLQLLEYLLPLAVGCRIMFALAVRGGECDAETASALTRIQRSAQLLPLAPLDAEACAALVAGRADAARVFVLSEGNPLFIQELLASSRVQGTLRLPALSSVRAVIRARVHALPSDSVAALHAAAILGRDFRSALVQHMLGGCDQAAALAPVLGLGMVSMSGPDRLRFSHALVAEALVDELSPQERVQLHLRAAEAYQQCEPGELAGIAHHLLSAGQLAAEAAVVAAERAAARCSAQLAFEAAAALLERALTFAILDNATRARLLCARAEALQHADRHADAGALCDEAAGLARELADAEQLARIAWVRGLEWRFGHVDPRLIASLQERWR
jgi:predicted ATPase